MNPYLRGLIMKHVNRILYGLGLVAIIIAVLYWIPIIVVLLVGMVILYTLGLFVEDVWMDYSKKKSRYSWESIRSNDL